MFFFNWFNVWIVFINLFDKVFFFFGLFRVIIVIFENLFCCMVICLFLEKNFDLLFKEWDFVLNIDFCYVIVIGFWNMIWGCKNKIKY